MHGTTVKIRKPQFAFIEFRVSVLGVGVRASGSGHNHTVNMVIIRCRGRELSAVLLHAVGGVSVSANCVLWRFQTVWSSLQIPSAQQSISFPLAIFNFHVLPFYLHEIILHHQRILVARIWTREQQTRTVNYCKKDMYRRQCFRCLLWRQLTLNLFDEPLYYSVSSCSLKATSTLQDIYHTIIYCTLTWKTREAVFALRFVRPCIIV